MCPYRGSRNGYISSSPYGTSPTKRIQNVYKTYTVSRSFRQKSVGTLFVFRVRRTRQTVPNFPRTRSGQPHVSGFPTPLKGVSVCHLLLTLLLFLTQRPRTRISVKDSVLLLLFGTTTVVATITTIFIIMISHEWSVNVIRLVSTLC